MEIIKMVIDNDVLNEYYDYYFSIHKKAKKKPIDHPYHESINKWMILKRPVMNALKQRWLNFIMWFVERSGLSNKRIDICSLRFTAYYNTRRRHDVDNSCPKFIIDGLCESGMIVDDDSNHITSLTLSCGVDPLNPRTEIVVEVERYLHNE